MNYQDGYHLPILGLLCDGRYFYFFQFVSGRQENTSPQFSMGIFPDGTRRISIESPEQGSDSTLYCQAKVREIRNACDCLYFVFLRGYQSGLEAYWTRSVERGKAAGKERTSTPGWDKAKIMAGKALEEAISAWNQHHKGKLAESKASAERALQFLTQRYKPRCVSSLVAVYANK